MPERPGSASRSFPEPAPRPARLPHGRGPGEARSLPQLPQSRRLHAQGRLPPSQGAQERRRMPRQALPFFQRLDLPEAACISRGERLCNLSCREIEVPCPFVVGQPLEDDLRIRCAHDLHDIGLRELLLEPSQRTSKLQGSSRIEALLVAEHPAPARGAPPRMRLPREAPPQASFPIVSSSEDKSAAGSQPPAALPFSYGSRAYASVSSAGFA